MNQTLGIINLINEKQILQELTSHRCLASVPFAGRYRLIDFTLSNFVHANITQVAVFVKEKYRSLMDHLGSGKEWDLDRRLGGLSVLPPLDANKVLKGDIQYFHDHLDFFEHADATHFIITPGHQVCKLDFKEAIQSHKRSRADITVLYKKYEGETIDKPVYHHCKVNQYNQVDDINLFSSTHQDENICLETYILSKELFLSLITSCYENQEYDFLKDAIKANLNKLDIRGYEFQGVLPFIYSTQSFFESNMKFLSPEYLEKFFYQSWDVYTKTKHDSPSMYDKNASVSNSIIANGCDIQGTVENSIIFRGVKIDKNAIVKNCIIMQKGTVEADAHIYNVITDKSVRITEAKEYDGSVLSKVIKKAGVI